MSLLTDFLFVVGTVTIAYVQSPLRREVLRYSTLVYRGIYTCRGGIHQACSSRHLVNMESPIGLPLSAPGDLSVNGKSNTLPYANKSTKDPKDDTLPPELSTSETDGSPH